MSFKNYKSKRECVDDFERDAKEFIELMMYRFYQGGSDEEITLHDSRQAFKRYRFRPMILRDVSNRDISTTILGHRIAFPCCISPSAFHKGAHPDGELTTAMAAASRNVGMSLSCGSNVLIEDIAKAAPNGLKMMQMYIYKNRKISELFVRRAEKADFNAMLVIVDFAVYGKRRGERDDNFYQTTRENPAYAHLECVNMNMMGEEARREKAAGDTLLWVYNDQADCSATWEDIKWVKRISSIPVVVKGVLTGEMAREAAAAGVDGILVSAHGGRQLDSAIGPLDAPPEVVEAVRGTNVEVYVDGGVRTGADILKALALGARAAFIGRPAIWGLGCGGEDGVKEVLDILKDEFDRAMALTGCANVGCVKRSLLADKNNFSRL
ncbi:2-Hydroxyacid oxidase 1-like [Diadema antillarum]|uniref:2-Hydroxyacid oxidase 1-like n=1 Tax=Diadema antillarum TaxID=105358 RepID=UPI003A8822DA